MSARGPFLAGPLLRAAALAAVVAAQGCGRPEPLTLRIGAKSPAGLAAWEDRERARLGPDLARDFDTALGEMRIRMMSGGGTGAAADKAVAAQVDGSTIGGVLLRGFGIRLARLDYERSLLEESLAKAGQRGSMPADRAPATYLAELHARQRARLHELRREMDATLRRLQSAAPPAQAGAPVGDLQPQAPAPSPRPGESEVPAGDLPPQAPVPLPTAGRAGP